MAAISQSVISLRLGNRCVGVGIDLGGVYVCKRSTQVQGQSQTIMIYQGSRRVSYVLVIVYLRVT